MEAGNAVDFRSATGIQQGPHSMGCRRRRCSTKRYRMKSRVQYDDDDDIRTKLIKREPVALTVEFERYIPPDSVRLQSSVPSSVHLGTCYKDHPRSTIDQPIVSGNRSEM